MTNNIDTEEKRPSKKQSKNGLGLALTAFIFTTLAFFIFSIGSSALLFIYGPPVIFDSSNASSNQTPDNLPPYSQPSGPSSGGGNGSEGNNPSQSPSGMPELILNPFPTDSEVESDADIVENVQKSVVTVITYELIVSSSSPVLSSTGSGIVISADGYILTNSHVVDNSKSSLVLIVDSTGKVYKSHVVGVDAKTDLAVLKTDETVSLTPAEFADSDELRAGDTVFTVGSPGGLEYAGTVAKGIVSATSRFVDAELNTLALIQTTALINPGNSGGALVNIYGQVVGVTSAKIVSESYEGMGFAIPTADARKIVNDLIKYGKVVNRVRLGIYYEQITPVDSVFYEIPQGIKITGMASDCVFKSTSVKSGDIITSVNGVQTLNAYDLYSALSEFKPGDTVSVTLYRSSQKTYFTVQITLIAE